MFSLHLTGSAWFLLLLPPGFFILWRQYRGGTAAAFPGAGRLLFALQAMALAVLVASLTRPEFRVHQVEFHNPAIAILRDQSTSFQGGGYLGLGRRYAGFENALREKYGPLGFDLHFVDFEESAWPAATLREYRKGEVRLTSFAALADFLDSASLPNLQAAFLFSDGIANLDSGRGSRSWKTPLFPVVFPPDSIAEAQPLRVAVSEAERARPAARAPAGMRAVEIEAWWRPVGRSGEDPELIILQGGKNLNSRKLPAGGDRAPGSDKAARNSRPADASTFESSVPADEGGIRKYRFAANLPINAREGTEPVRAVLRPAKGILNFNPFNDTLGVSFSRVQALRTIHVFRPVRGLDEKGMLDILSAWEGTRVAFFGMGDSARFAPAAGDQVWVEAGSVVPGGRLHAWLGALRAKVVLYVRPEPGRNLQVPGLGAAPWRAFSPSAGISAASDAAEAFPADILRLKAIASAPLEAPDAATAGDAWVEARESGRRGMVMGRISLGSGKRAFFFCLPAIWESLFDPQGDFATRENIAAFIRSAHALADREDGAVRVSMPGRVFDKVPFNLSISLPRSGDTAGSEISGGDSIVFAITGEGFSREWPLDAGGRGETGIGKVELPTGAYSLELRSAAKAVWRDSLEVAPRAALELARIGFDMDVLRDAASRSGGRVVSLEADEADAGRVSSELPGLAAAQVRAEKSRTIPLYNTLVQFLLVVLLLSLSWVLRKKWDID